MYVCLYERMCACVCVCGWVGGCVCVVCCVFVVCVCVYMNVYITILSTYFVLLLISSCISIFITYLFIYLFIFFQIYTKTVCNVVVDKQESLRVPGNLAVQRKGRWPNTPEKQAPVFWLGFRVYALATRTQPDEDLGYIRDFTLYV